MSLHAVLVPIDDALNYTRDILAGFDNLLIELGERLADDLPDGLTAEQRDRLRRIIAERIDAARLAVEEH